MQTHILSRLVAYYAIDVTGRLTYRPTSWPSICLSGDRLLRDLLTSCRIQFCLFTDWVTDWCAQWITATQVLTLSHVSIARWYKECPEKNRCHSINHWQTVTWRWVTLITQWIDSEVDIYCIRAAIKQRNNAIFSPIQEDIVVHDFATLCLASLSVDFACKVKISDNNGLPPLIQLLSSPDPDVKKNSLEIIFNLVQVTQSHQSREGYKGMGEM